MQVRIKLKVAKYLCLVYFYLHDFNVRKITSISHIFAKNQNLKTSEYVLRYYFKLKIAFNVDYKHYIGITFSSR